MAGKVKVRMTARLRGMVPGQEVEVSEPDAVVLVAAGCAERVKAAPKRKTKDPEPDE